MSDPTGPRIDPSAVGPEAVLLDCRAGPDRGGYDRSHVHGAHRVDLELDLSAVGDAADGGRHPLPPILSWAATLGRWGIGPDTPVAVYDGAGGGLYAARCWWMLRAIGHTRVWVVDGGHGGLVAAGRSVDADPVPPVDGEPYPLEHGDWRWPVVDAEAVDRARQHPDWRVVDARSAPRWRGEEEPIDPVAGRIPGSVNLPWEQTVVDGRLAADLAERLAVLDVPDDRVIAHCGSGVTACALILALDAVGRGPVPLYVGSWSEWCRQDRPRGAG